jgi:hypothetical protein
MVGRAATHVAHRISVLKPSKREAPSAIRRRLRRNMNSVEFHHRSASFGVAFAPIPQCRSPLLAADQEEGSP